MNTWSASAKLPGLPSKSSFYKRDCVDKDKKNNEDTPMSDSQETLERVDELLLQGKQRRELEEALETFRKRMKRQTLLGYIHLFIGFVLATTAVYSGLFLKVGDHYALRVDGGLHFLIMAGFFFYSGSTLLWKKPSDHLLLALVERTLRDDNKAK